MYATSYVHLRPTCKKKLGVTLELTPKSLYSNLGVNLEHNIRENVTCACDNFFGRPTEFDLRCKI